jgi:hypothetical protein
MDMLTSSRFWIGVIAGIAAWYFFGMFQAKRASS